MPSIGIKLYSVFFKFMLKHRLQSRLESPENGGGGAGAFGVTSRPDEETAAAANPSFTDGVATKDIHIDPLTSVSVRIFLPDTCLHQPDSRARPRAGLPNSGPASNQKLNRRNSDGFLNEWGVSSGGIDASVNRAQSFDNGHRRRSYGGSVEDANLKSEAGGYRGYKPVGRNSRRLPVMLQFHGGGFVSGSNDSEANDFFCRRIARLCEDSNLCRVAWGTGHRERPILIQT